jgi:hypothetical protein
VHDPGVNDRTVSNPTARDARQAAPEPRPLLRPTRSERRPRRGPDADDGVPQLDFDRLETPPIGNPVV